MNLFGRRLATLEATTEKLLNNKEMSNVNQFK